MSDLRAPRARTVPETLASEAIRRFMQALVITIGAILILLAATPASAHEWWLQRAPSGYQLQFGHAFGDHEGDPSIEYDPDSVGGIHCLGTDGSASDFSVHRGWPLRIEGACPALATVVDGGTWTRTIEGLRNLPPDGLEGVVDSWRVLDTAKRLEDWTPALARPLTGALEIVPLDDPAGGGGLRLRITLAGEPLAGVAVRQDGDFAGTSDDEGELRVTVDSAVPVFFDARYSAPADEDGGAIRHTTTLLLDRGP